jgi:hypothetical protein
MKIKHQTLKKSNGMMMGMMVPQIIQKWKMIPQIHLSNSYCFLCAAASIAITLPFCSGERDFLCFLCSAALIVDS